MSPQTETANLLPVGYSLEETTLGTSGATKEGAFRKVKGDVSCVMNVDDIAFYNPSLNLGYLFVE